MTGSLSPVGPPASDGFPGYPDQAATPRPSAPAASAPPPSPLDALAEMVDIDPLRSAALVQREALLLAAWTEILRDWQSLSLPVTAGPSPASFDFQPSTPSPEASDFSAFFRRVAEVIAVLDDELSRLLDADPELSRLDRQIARVLAELERRARAGQVQGPREPHGTPPAPAGEPTLTADEELGLERLARAPLQELERALDDLQRREGERIEAQPRLVALREARQRLVAIQERLENYQTLAAGESRQGEEGAVDLALKGPPWGEVQLRIGARGGGGGGGRAPGERPRGGRGVAVGLSLDSGSLGPIEGELLLWGRVLGLNLRLGGAAERDFVAAGFGELQHRLTALDLEPVLWATLRAPPRGVGMDPVAAERSPGLDLRG